MIKEERYSHTNMQYVNLKRFDFVDTILDIGGGGDGVIGLLYGKKVIAIDKLEEELLETNNDAVNIVMDACNLDFSSKKFDMVTFFYSLMYMNKTTKDQALKEAMRVLKPGGRLEIWDTEVPEFLENNKDIQVADISINIDGIKLKTSYGVRIEDKQQTLKSISLILKKYSDSIITPKKEGQAFHIILKK